MSTFQIKGYDHDGVLLNVSVERDEDGCVIERVTVGNDGQNIAHFFSGAQLQSMADCIDASLSREARQSNVAARAERHQWHREFAIA